MIISYNFFVYNSILVYIVYIFLNFQFRYLLKNIVKAYNSKS